MAVLLDVTPLRVSPDFRRLWTGQAVSFLGTTVTSAALPFQVYDQTGSSLAVGLLFLALIVVAFLAFGAALAYVNVQAARRPDA